MQNYASIFRTEELLLEGTRELHDLWGMMQTELHVGDTSLIWNNDLVDALETDNLMRQATATMTSAFQRCESRGAHWRQDFPARDDANCLAHSICFVDDNGNSRFTIRPVRLHSEDIESKTLISFPPEERAY